MTYSRLMFVHPRSCPGAPAPALPAVEEEDDQAMQEAPPLQPADDNDLAMDDATLQPPSDDGPLQPAVAPVTSTPADHALAVPTQQLTDNQRLQQSVETFVLENITG